MKLAAINTNIIVDFDSTFVKLEGLEELAKISLCENPRRDEIVKEIEAITNEGMSGKISFEESLEMRLRLFESNKDDISKLITMLQNNITDSILSNKLFFKDNSSNIYIISGGFDDWIYPIVLPFGIKKENILSNKFFYDGKGNITGIDRSIPLTKTGGKSKCVRDLNLKGKKIIIGDGYTDFEVMKNGEADKFILFIENVHRKDLDLFADNISINWNEVIKFLNG